MTEKVSEKTAKSKSVSVEDFAALRDSIGYFGRKLDGIVKVLEQTFGIDINKDGNIGSAKVALMVAVFVLSVGVAMAANVWKVGATGAEVTVDDSGNISADGSISASGLTVSGAIVGASASQTVTNGQEITLSPGMNIVTPSGMANGQTNVVTLVNATDGNCYEVIVASGATNVLGIADSGNVSLSAAFNGAANDYLALYGYSTSYVETSRSDN